MVSVNFPFHAPTIFVPVSWSWEVLVALPFCKIRPPRHLEKEGHESGGASCVPTDLQSKNLWIADVYLGTSAIEGYALLWLRGTSECNKAHLM